jgi:NAD(P)-dependent dehydrogenase (short-subunit alcohol dehydrogenase family)
MDLSFESKVALVTGASSGIGLATAKAFAEANASVVLADNNEDTLRAATYELTSAGHKATGCDVADEAQVAAMVERPGFAASPRQAVTFPWSSQRNVQTIFSQIPSE